MDNNIKIPLDKIIREMCSEAGDSYAHRYAYFYQHCIAWLRKMDNRRGNLMGPKYIWIPVVNGRAYVPNVTGISKVGRVVGGHIVEMMCDPNMVDKPDPCGDLTADRPVNPDIPAIRTNGQLPTLYTGPNTGFGYYSGYNYSLNGIGYSAGYGFGTRYGSGFALYFPRASAHSIYGYYRHFTEQGYILLDASTNISELVLECSTVTVQTGEITMVSIVAVDAMKSYVRSQLTTLNAEVSTMDRPMVALRKQEQGVEYMIMRDNLNRQPVSEHMAVLRRPY